MHTIYVAFTRFVPGQYTTNVFSCNLDFAVEKGGGTLEEHALSFLAMRIDEQVTQSFADTVKMAHALLRYQSPEVTYAKSSMKCGEGSVHVSYSADMIRALI